MPGSTFNDASPEQTGGTHRRPIANVVERIEQRAAALTSANDLSSAALRAGDLVRSMRTSAGLSQAALAAQMGVSQARVSEIEAGAGPHGPTWDVMERVAAVCGRRLLAVDKPLGAQVVGPSGDLPWWIGDVGGPFGYCAQSAAVAAGVYGRVQPLSSRLRAEVIHGLGHQYGLAGFAVAQFHEYDLLTGQFPGSSAVGARILWEPVAVVGGATPVAQGGGTSDLPQGEIVIPDKG